MPKISLFLLAFAFLLFSCTPSGVIDPVQVKHAKAENAMVVSAHPLATKVGLDILKNGGNAIDASIAVQFALAVVYPRAGNIGGGGFMVIRDTDGKAHTLDYREKAPLKAHRDMYLGEDGLPISEKSRAGGLAVGVPGVVDGMIEAHKRFGKMPFETLIQPAIDIATKGYYLSKEEADRFNKYKEEFLKYNTQPFIFTQDALWSKGDLFVQTQLAETLKIIQSNGRAGFYKGEIAQNMLKEINNSGGIFSQEDLDLYKAKWRAPIKFNYKEYEIISMGPPSSGGIALAQILGMMETHNLDSMAFQSTEHIHLMVEAERRAFSDRAKYLGDTDFYPVPIDSLLDEPYLRSRISDMTHEATPSSDVEHDNFVINKESMETTHFSIVDSTGMAVSVTTTLNANFGSKLYTQKCGFFLNNEMDDFSAKPGVPNMYGLVGGEANAIYPQKRMLSSMTPTIITKDDKLYMVVGTPGGSTIITTVAQVFLNVSAFNMNISEAVNKNRFHHQWLPDLIYQEPNTLDSSVVKNLEARGYKFGEFKKIGDVDAIHVTEHGLEGGADRRGLDHAAGF